MDPVSKNIGLPLNQFFDVAEPGGRGFDEGDLDELRRAADSFEAIFVAQFIKRLALLNWPKMCLVIRRLKLISPCWMTNIREN